MDKAKHEAVIAAISELIADEAVNGHPATKFRNIAKLSDHGIELHKLGADRVADAGAFLQDGGAGYGPNPYLAHLPVAGDVADVAGLTMPVTRPYGAGENVARYLGQQQMEPSDLVRTLADQIARLKEPRAKSRDERVDQLVDRLDRLIGIRDAAHKNSGIAELVIVTSEHMDRLDQLITQTADELAKETTHATDDTDDARHADDSDVADPDVLRGRQTGSDERDVVRGNHDRSDADGAVGDRQARGVGEEKGMVGAVHQQVGNDRVEGADREGGEGAQQATQARPDDRQRNSLQRWNDGGDPRLADAVINTIERIDHEQRERDLARRIAEGHSASGNEGG